MEQSFGVGKMFVCFHPVSSCAMNQATQFHSEAITLLPKISMSSPPATQINV